MELSALRLDASQLSPDPVQPGSAPNQDAAQEMEKLFATLIVKELSKALPNGFFGKGAGSDIFEGWMQEHMGQSLAESGALDLAGSIKASLDSKARMSEEAVATSQPYRETAEALPGLSSGALRPLATDKE